MSVTYGQSGYVGQSRSVRSWDALVDGKRARRFLRSGLDTKLDYNEQVQNQAIGKEGVPA